MPEDEFPSTTVALFLVLIQSPGFGITVVLGNSSSGIKEDRGEGLVGPKEENREFISSASGLDTIIRFESNILGSTSSLAGWKLFFSGILISCRSESSNISL